MRHANVHPIFREILGGFAPCRATGNHCAAANDEPEPEVLPPVRTLRDVLEEADEAARAARGDLEAIFRLKDRQALERQISQGNRQDHLLKGLYE